MKIIIGLFILLLLVVGGIVFSQNYFKGNGVQFFGKTTTATIKEKKINLIVAKTPEEKQTGLSKRKDLAKDQGMLFPFEKADYYSFWMKDMQFPIDILFISKDSIVTIFSNVKPPEENQSPIIYKPTEPADKVLEVNAGFVEENKLKVGDKIIIENL